MRDRDEQTQDHVNKMLYKLQMAKERRRIADGYYLEECVLWEDTVREVYEAAIRINSKELAPTITEMADALEISEKTFQHVRHRSPGTAVWPRPQTSSGQDA